jgi:hypothetical protein
MSVFSRGDSAIIKKIRKATAEWSESIRKDGKGHQHGPPCLWAWAALLPALIDEDIGAVNKQSIGQAFSQCNELSIEQKGMGIKLCRIRKTLRAVVMAALVQCKCEMKPGRAPMGPKEAAGDAGGMADLVPDQVDDEAEAAIASELWGSSAFTFD